MQKNHYWVGYLVAPLIVLATLIILFWQGGLYPFGDGSISWCDMSQQYVPLLADFKKMLEGEDGFFFSFSNAGGMNFYAVFFFFLSSPFSFLALFVDAGEMMRFANIITMLKMATIALTAEIYFTRRAKKDRMSLLVPLLLSVSYAFCGYVMVYYQNNSWLDEMYLFPLLMLALDELMHNKKVWPYSLTVALGVIFNFYIGVMMAIFCLLYFLMYYLFSREENKGDKKQVAFLFLMGSAAAVFLSAVVWLPSVLGVFDSARLSATVLDNIETDAWVCDLDTTLSVVLSNGALVGAVILSLVFYKDIQRGMIKRMVLLILLTIPLFLEPVNLIWHLGSYMAFPARYGFMTVFVGLCVGYDAMIEPPVVFEKKRWHLPLGIVLCLLTVAYVWFMQFFYTKNTEVLTTYINNLWGSQESLGAFLVIFGVSAFIGALLYFSYRIGANRILCAILAGIIILSQACLDLKSYMVSVNGSDYAFAGMEDLKQALPSQEEGFYRIKERTRLSYENYDGVVGNALSHYTSLTDENTLYQMKQWGYSSYWMKLASYGGTEFSDAFFGCQYEMIGLDRMGKLLNKGIYKEGTVYQNDRYALKERRFSFPMGIFAGMEDLTTGYMDRLEYQEEFYEQLFPGAEPLFVRYEPTSEDNVSITYKIYVKGQQILYFDAFGAYSNRLNESTNKSFDVYANNNCVKSSYPAQSLNGILCLGLFEDETVTVKVKFRKTIDFAKFSSFGLSGLRTDVMERACEMAQGKVDLVQKGSSLSGLVTVEDASLPLLLSLTYDKNFTLWVDGQKQTADKMIDQNGYLSLILPEGEHQISLTYVSPGFWPGLFISLGSALLLGILWLVNRYSPKAKGKITYQKWMGKLAEPVLVVVCCLVFAVLYIFPVVYKLICLF